MTTENNSWFGEKEEFNYESINWRHGDKSNLVQVDATYLRHLEWLVEEVYPIAKEFAAKQGQQYRGAAREGEGGMKCKYPNCGKLRDDSRHDFITINMPICLEYHPFEPAEPEAAAPQSPLFNGEINGTTALDGDTRRACNNEDCCKDYQHEGNCDTSALQPAAPVAEPVNTWARRNEHAKLVAENGPRVDMRRFPPAHYFCAECGKTPEPCPHFSIATQATEARPQETCCCDKPIRTNTIPWWCQNCNKPFVKAAAQKVEQPAIDPQYITCICGVTFLENGMKARQFHEECPKQRFINNSCPACGSTEHFHACPHRQKLNPHAEAGSTRPDCPLTSEDGQQFKGELKEAREALKDLEGTRPITVDPNWCEVHQVIMSSCEADRRKGCRMGTRPEIPPVTKMYVCEIAHLALHVGQRYQFMAHPECQGCRDYFGAASVPQEPLSGQLKKLRDDGWMVAVHNDYRLDGKAHTFWLFTRIGREGQFVKGEGETDQDALDQVFRQLNLHPNAQPAARRTQGREQCDRCFEVSNQVLEHVNVLENANDSEEYYSAAFELRKILPSLDQFINLEIEDALKAATPPSPPTPRWAELAAREIIFCSEADISLVAAIIRKHVANLQTGSNYCKNCGNRIYFDAGGPLREIWRHEGSNFEQCIGGLQTNAELAQARTQPSPRTTLPDHYKFADEWVGTHYVHKYPTQVISDIPVMDAVQMLADFVQQFFTALPEATNEDK